MDFSYYFLWLYKFTVSTKMFQKVPDMWKPIFGSCTETGCTLCTVVPVFTLRTK